MRIMGMDYGEKTIGIAVSDPFGWTAQGVEIIRRKDENNLKESMERIKELIEQYDVKKIVLGFPKNMNNTLGVRAEKTLEFKEKLEKRFSIEVILWDERLSTKAAESILLEADISRSKRKKVIDKMAAVYILQGYLDSKC
ncbi:Holliday junction resolvase RuvX [Defluviitalea raffinosedens]|uniref:Putative pre-16S rRNA nuclease n=1 Tax=Defluviitalea raffinosedens TaxID=1450156 RepID=A0A7C8LLF1_9FIRM|nr:Holliday junction resolvase RuvX [Defluviitalea raffinosedens]KAE9637264.1 Holliday junction resolvase RuvX [Defluviitalea raffinosedens]MBM7685567.1 putative Holliday junction resolvase [Defluviitalea raffinosedens]HHW66704.1 Holliday junction resolvase RuvX [Candidatus Epulonipiscium sp.]